MKLLLSLYACRPNEGSEPGVGWAWALGMAKRHETMVVTRTFSRSKIEAELERLGLPESERPKFLFVEGPKWALHLRDKNKMPTHLYYVFWLFAARRSYDHCGWKADVIHHVTFNSFQIPGVWWNRREKVVLGPLGGMAACPIRFLRCFSFVDRIKELMRISMRVLWRLNPFFLAARRSADCLLFTESSVAQRIGGPAALLESVFETAVSDELLRGPVPPFPRNRFRFLWASRLEGRKACEIAIRAYARAVEVDPRVPPFEIVGTGPYLHRIERLVRRLGVADRVSLVGPLPQVELWRRAVEAIAFVFTSVRDTSGNVVLEAMALGTPVICFDHQGVAALTDDSCAIRIKPKNWNQSIKNFADAMLQLACDPTLVERMGLAGRKRALERFTWKEKFDLADSVYEKVLANQGRT